MVKIWPSHEVYPLSTDQCLEGANCLLVSEDRITVIEKNISVRDKQWNVSTFLFGKLFREKGSEWARVYSDVMDDKRLLSMLQWPRKDNSDTRTARYC